MLRLLSSSSRRIGTACRPRMGTRGGFSAASWRLCLETGLPTVGPGLAAGGCIVRAGGRAGWGAERTAGTQLRGFQGGSGRCVARLAGGGRGAVAYGGGLFL